MNQDSQEQFIRLFTKHRDRIYGTLRLLVPDPMDADDILQDLSITLMRKFGDFIPGTRFDSWACSIARYHVLNHRRSRRRDRLLFSSDVMELVAETDKQIEDLPEEALASLSRCREGLNADQRRLLALRFEERLNNRKIAARLERNEATISRSFSRIYSLLLDCMRTGSITGLGVAS